MGGGTMIYNITQTYKLNKGKLIPNNIKNMNEEVCKEPEIVARLNLIGNKINQLRDKLSPISVLSPIEKVDSVPTKEQSISMQIINNIIEDLDEIRDSIDIN